MLTKESDGSSFDLPEEVLEVLPSDPFEQLDVARKITSLALSTRVSALESDSDSLRAQLAEKDHLIADLQSQIESLDSSLSDVSDKLARADSEKENLLRENASLSNTVKKLQRDVSKLEVFRKTLMQSLQEDEDGSAGTQHIIAKPTPNEDDVILPPSRESSIRSQFSETGNSFAEDRESNASKPGISRGILIASQTSTPKLTPPGSPPIVSASVSLTRTSKPASSRRHSMSFSTSRGLEDRSSMFSSLPSGQHSSTSSSDTVMQTLLELIMVTDNLQDELELMEKNSSAKSGKSRLSYGQFGAFLANVKELNSHKQTKEDTLRKADEIFGPDNQDLYTIFEGLISRK